MSTSKSTSEKAQLTESGPNSPADISGKSNSAQNPLRGSYGKVNRVIRDKTPGEKAAEKPKSRKLAMEAMCWDCQGGDHADLGYRWNIGNCLSNTCPLWNLRPYQHKAGTPGEGVYKEYYGDGESEDSVDESIGDVGGDS